MENHILQMVGVFLCHLRFFGIFSFDLLRLSCWGCVAPIQSVLKGNQLTKLPWRKFRMTSRVTLAEEWILNILTLILQDTPGGNTATCTSVIETLKTHIFTDSCLWIWTPRHKALIKRTIRQMFNLIVIIRLYRQNLRGSFSGPILSSGCSCVKPMLAVPSNVTSDVVFTSKKRVFF